ncbi:hypothetical protein U1708_12620 [Sphingomonas sp. ZB1N12]
MLIALTIFVAWIVGNAFLMLGLYLAAGGMADLRRLNRFGERRARQRTAD